MTDEPTPVRRTRLVAVLLLVGVFAAGGLAGMAIDELRAGPQAAEERQGRMVFRGGPGGGPESRRDGLSPAALLAEQLDLTPAQRDEIETIFDRRRDQLSAVLAELEPRLQAQRDSANMEIRAVLTEEQRVEFDQRAAERSRIRVRAPGRGPGPGPRPQ
ncbi:MAG: hypothetical protein WD737_07180 [Gemmatimonadota bacterium]